MAHDLYARLMHESDDNVNYKNIGKHAFFAMLREYARRKISKTHLYTIFNFEVGDLYLEAFINKIDAKSNETNRLAFVKVLEDIHLINESLQTKSLYPSKEALLNRADVA